MKLLVRSALIVGIAAFAVAGTALAGNFDRKVMTVNLSDGLAARVEYQGDVAPKVIVESHSPELAAAWSRSTWVPFTIFDRISTDMDRQFDAMVHRVHMLDTLPADDMDLMNRASDQALPAGSARYSYVATSSGNGFCVRSVKITSEGANQKPRITSSTSGECAAETGSAPAANSAAPAHRT